MREDSSETILYSFAGSPDGQNPEGRLTAGGQGLFYGTTTYGGANSLGTAFTLTASGSGYLESIIYNFGNSSSDGENPYDDLFADAKGALYGSTFAGGTSTYGTVFKLTPSGSGFTENILYNFGPGTDGRYPVGGVTADSTGALYGTTVRGGESSTCGISCGTVYKLTPSGSGYVETVIHSFQGGSDGAVSQGDLILDKKSAVYGTTYYGGSGSCSKNGYTGCGIVFELVPSGSAYNEKVLYNFQGGADGAYPIAGLLAGKRGILYGTTYQGGTNDNGTVFSLKPSRSGYAETVIYKFKGGSDGSGPAGALIAGKKNAIYGTTYNGGSSGVGVVFKLTPSRSKYSETILHSFGAGADGAQPQAGVIADKLGALYGTTQNGGTSGNGTVFKITP